MALENLHFPVYINNNFLYNWETNYCFGEIINLEKTETTTEFVVKTAIGTNYEYVFCNKNILSFDYKNNLKKAQTMTSQQAKELSMAKAAKSIGEVYLSIKLAAENGRFLTYSPLTKDQIEELEQNGYKIRYSEANNEYAIEW